MPQEAWSAKREHGSTPTGDSRLEDGKTATVAQGVAAPSLQQGDAGPESPPVADVEARAAAPLLVSSVEAVARSRLLTVAAQTRLVEVAARLSSAQISVVVVCDAAGAALGIITETMLVRRLGLGQADLFTTAAGDVMTAEFTTCAAQEQLSDVLAMMHTRGLIHVLLVDANRHPLGVLNARDGLRALLAAGNHEEALLRNYVTGVGYQ
jgi:arabinose-5-phosphate isomerase